MKMNAIPLRQLCELSQRDVAAGNCLLIAHDDVEAHSIASKVVVETQAVAKTKGVRFQLVDIDGSRSLTEEQLVHLRLHSQWDKELSRKEARTGLTGLMAYLEKMHHTVPEEMLTLITLKVDAADLATEELHRILIHAHGRGVKIVLILMPDLVKASAADIAFVADATSVHIFAEGTDSWLDQNAFTHYAFMHSGAGHSYRARKINLS